MARKDKRRKRSSGGLALLAHSNTANVQPEKPFCYTSRLSALRELVSRTSDLELVSRGVFRRQHSVVGSDNHGRPVVLLHFNKLSITAPHFVGGLLAIQAGMAVGERGREIADGLIRAVSKANKRFSDLNGRKLFYDYSVHKFLAHASDMTDVMDFRRSLAEPVRSFVKPAVYISNNHRLNREIVSEIFKVFPSHVLIGDKKARFSVATVEKEGALHVSLHQVPPCPNDTAPLEDRVGPTLWQMEQQGIPLNLIAGLKKLGVKKLYSLSSSGLVIRRVFDLDEELAAARFRSQD